MTLAEFMKKNPKTEVKLVREEGGRYLYTPLHMRIKETVLDRELVSCLNGNAVVKASNSF